MPLDVTRHPIAVTELSGMETACPFLSTNRNEHNMTIDTGQWDTLSDDDAVALLYELANKGDNGSNEFVQLDSMVYQRLLQAYDEAAITTANNQATGIGIEPASPSPVPDGRERALSFGEPIGTMG